MFWKTGLYYGPPLLTIKTGWLFDDRTQLSALDSLQHQGIRGVVLLPDLKYAGPNRDGRHETKKHSSP